jgi:hypothetical protein
MMHRGVLISFERFVLANRISRRVPQIRTISNTNYTKSTAEILSESQALQLNTRLDSLSVEIGKKISSDDATKIGKLVVAGISLLIATAGWGIKWAFGVTDKNYDNVRQVVSDTNQNTITNIGKRIDDTNQTITVLTNRVGEVHTEVRDVRLELKELRSEVRLYFKDFKEEVSSDLKDLKEEVRRGFAQLLQQKDSSLPVSSSPVPPPPVSSSPVP